MVHRMLEHNISFITFSHRELAPKVQRHSALSQSTKPYPPFNIFAKPYLSGPVIGVFEKIKSFLPQVKIFMTKVVIFILKHESVSTVRTSKFQPKFNTFRDIEMEHQFLHVTPTTPTTPTISTYDSTAPTRLGGIDRERGGSAICGTVITQTVNTQSKGDEQ